MRRPPDWLEDATSRLMDWFLLFYLWLAVITLVGAVIAGVIVALYAVMP